MRRLTWTSATLLLFACPAIAQTRPAFGFLADAGYSETPAFGGAGVAIGATWTVKRLHYGFGLDWVFGPPAKDNRYYLDTFSNGQTRCRDSETGRFAPTSACHGDIIVATAIAAEVDFRLFETQPFVLGAGFRVGDGGGPVGILAYSKHFETFPARWYARAMRGPEFTSVRWGVIVGQR